MRNVLFIYSQPEGQRQTESERCRQMHADHRQTDTGTERGRQETHSQRGADRCMLTIQTDAVTERGRQETERDADSMLTIDRLMQ